MLQKNFVEALEKQRNPSPNTTSSDEAEGEETAEPKEDTNSDVDREEEGENGDRKYVDGKQIVTVED